MRLHGGAMTAISYTQQYFHRGGAKTNNVRPHFMSNLHGFKLAFRANPLARQITPYKGRWRAFHLGRHVAVARQQ